MKRALSFVLLALGSLSCDRARASHSMLAAPVRQSSAATTGTRAICDAAAPARGGDLHALAAGKRGVRLEPESSDAWVSLGRAWVAVARSTADPGFYFNANACSDAALELAPKNLTAFELRSFALLNDHRFREARDVGETILAQDPDRPTAWSIVADALLELGDLDGSEHAVQRMLDLRPDLASYSRAAHLMWLRGDRAGAKLASERAVEAGLQSHDPEPLAWVLVDTALLFWHDGDYPAADAGFDVALTRLPDFPPALVGKARVRMARHEFVAAAQLLNRAFEKNPTTETAWLLADARRLAGDARGADEAEAWVVAEGRLRDRRALALFYAAKKRQPEDAVRLAQAELVDRPSLYTKDAVAWTLYRAGRLQEARTLSDEVAQVGTPDARLLFHAGAIRLATGDTTSGRALIRRALAQNPAFDCFEADEAKTLLETGT